LGGEAKKFNKRGLSTNKRPIYALSPEQQAEAKKLKERLAKRSEYMMSMPEKPEGYEFIYGFAVSLEMDNLLLTTWLESGQLGGEILKFRNDSSSRTGSSYALSPEQQEVARRLKAKIDESIAGLKEKPKEYEFTVDFADTIMVHRTTLNSWLTSGRLGGEVKKFINQSSSHDGTAYALSPEQQSVSIELKRKADKRLEHSANLPEKLEGYVFVHNFAKSLGADVEATTVRLWLMSGRLGGEIHKFRNPDSPSASRSYALSPEQQNEAKKIHEENEKRLAAFPEKPEEYEFAPDFAKRLEIDTGKLIRRLKSRKLGGEAKEFRNRRARATGLSYALSPSQQAEALRLKAEKSL